MPSSAFELAPARLAVEEDAVSRRFVYPSPANVSARLAGGGNGFPVFQPLGGFMPSKSPLHSLQHGANKACLVGGSITGGGARVFASLIAVPGALSPPFPDFPIFGASPPLPPFLIPCCCRKLFI